MGVHLWITSPRGAMPKRGRHQPRGRQDLSPAMATAHCRRGTLEVADSLENGAVVPGTHRGAHLAVADAEQNADALGRREGQIEPGDLDRARRAPQRRPVQRIQTLEHPAKCLAAHRPFDVERPAAGFDPAASGLGAAGVVLLDAVADAQDRVDAHLSLVEVALGLAGRQLADRKHRCRLSRWQRPSGQIASGAVSSPSPCGRAGRAGAPGRAQPDVGCVFVVVGFV